VDFIVVHVIRSPTCRQKIVVGQLSISPQWMENICGFIGQMDELLYCTSIWVRAAWDCSPVGACEIYRHINCLDRNDGILEHQKCSLFSEAEVEHTNKCMNFVI